MAWQNAAINAAQRIEIEARAEIYEAMRAAGFSHSEAERESQIEARREARDWLAANTQF